ncbi:lipid kinase YegS [Azomonas macrocytogenes]|uniref:Probable lipid kinase YegS-like n=1 Tax=Azomonas macrocytogenes TaxID=69962 RepID=A0A839T7M1_AZOMA|nr:lipid kinase YegS [Azomonas macrocytogenes]MBB3104850.1 lipid kinase YegS [Azomonas macrocytogenes]
MSKLRACLILNGKQANNEGIRTAVHLQRERGWDLSVRVTWEASDVSRLVQEALADGHSILVAGGGDGTLGEVADALLKAKGEASLVLLPLGTANDFATAAGIPLEPVDALELLDTPPVAVDLGKMNSRFFLNIATGGFGSQVTANTSEDLKRFLGGGAYLLTGLTRFAEVHSVRGRFHGPDFEWEGDFFAFGIGNGRQAGGGQELCPRALIDDGLLDLCIIPAPTDTVSTLGTLLARGLHGVEAISLNARLPWIDVSFPEALDINLDGEPASNERMHFSIQPQALRLHLPADSPLLKANSDAEPGEATGGE